MCAVLVVYDQGRDFVGCIGLSRDLRGHFFFINLSFSQNGEASLSSQMRAIMIQLALGA